jgi:N-acetylmuramoyl-L-alanine amidase
MVLPLKPMPRKEARRASMNANGDRLVPLAHFNRPLCPMFALFVWLAVLPCAQAEAGNPMATQGDAGSSEAQTSRTTEPVADAVQTPPAPTCDRANFRMIIDVGHTVTNYGAVSAHGKPEFDFNRRLAQELATRLWDNGFGQTEAVIQTDSDLQKRARDLSSRRPNLMLSLHHDSVQDKYLKTGELDGQIRTYTEGFRGYSIFVSRDNAYLDDSERFAKMLGGELLAQGLNPTFHHHEQENRPIYDAQTGVFFFDLLVVLRQTNAPAVLLESAIITNPEDEAKADDPAYRTRITDAIVSAVISFCDARAQSRAAAPPSPAPKPASPDKSGSRK